MKRYLLIMNCSSMEEAESQVLAVGDSFIFAPNKDEKYPEQF